MKLYLLVIASTLLLRISFAQIIIRPETVKSLLLVSFKDTTEVGRGTGFVIKSKTRFYLITNWHVVTNKDPKTKNWIDKEKAKQIEPNKLAIIHNGKNLGDHVIKWEALTDSKGLKQFKEYNLGAGMVDVIALPLKDTIPDLTIYTVDYHPLPDSVYLSPTERLFVVGFPLGITSNSSFPIWKSGLIASEPDLDQEGKPIIWIDGVGYPGMSGSPVYFLTDKLIYKKGGSFNSVGPPITYFIGVYSHIYPSIGLGALWKGTYLKRLFDQLP
ncbi:trypsin-like peptidase domain-containing protein [Spirosoma aureum]|uniref:Trypsin-like peptidase domain-containing protein n=1 Tax=Spirosoma aureum TaxID=2692134 RepID=A0A6G9AQK8_9BACT|nr:serine protease [Spirosoma aureum]QIP14771.1 trypsin-like peptidase domain-containing protein [Spirosoma aureum]